MYPWFLVVFSIIQPWLQPYCNLQYNGAVELLGCMLGLLIMAKTKSSPKKRKTRSDKFPLTLHPTGQFCKKIKGKLYYFGTDKTKALHRYLEEATCLHAGRCQMRKLQDGSIGIKTLCNLYLEHQATRVQANELTVRHNMDQIKSLRMLVCFLGQHCLVGEISALDLQNPAFPR